MYFKNKYWIFIYEFDCIIFFLVLFIFFFYRFQLIYCIIAIMWIPHTIPKSTINLFTPLDIEKSRPYDVARNIKSENFSWAECMPKPLKLRCVDSIANNFTLYPRNLFEWISPMNAVYLVETLDTDLQIPLVIHVPDGEYWRRRINDTWSANLDGMPGDSATDHGFRAYYLTRYVSEMVENMEPEYLDEEEFSRLLEACCPYVSTLDCRHLRTPDSLLYRLLANESEELASDPVHVNIGFVLARLHNVTAVSLVYCPKKLFLGQLDSCKIHVKDMDSLGGGLVLLNHLTSLSVTKSDLNLTNLNRLLPYLTECYQLEVIDFSFSTLSCLGAKSVAYYMKTAKRLKSINLCDNNIGSDGVESLAFVMLWRRKEHNDYPPIELNLSKY